MRGLERCGVARVRHCREAHDERDAESRLARAKEYAWAATLTDFAGTMTSGRCANVV